MSLRWRLALVTATLVAVAVGTASWAGYVLTANELRDGIDRSLLDAARAEAPQSGDRRPPRARPVTGSGTLTQQLDRDGDVRRRADPALPVTDADLAVARAGSGTTAWHDAEIDGEPVRVLTVGVPDGALQIARSTAQVTESLDNLRSSLLIVAGAVTAAAAALVWLVAGRVTAPVVRLTGAAEQIAGTGDLTSPIEVARHDEVGRLAVAFNAMVAALAASRDQQRQLVLDASHELRTPLTTLRTNIELLARNEDLPVDERRELLDAATVELGELTALVTELVDLAVERGGLDLGELVGRVVERARRRTGRPIHLALQDPALVEGMPTLVERAVSNLLDNAAKFSPEGTPIEVTVAGGTTTVDDHGPGIPPGERTLVFQRFHRSPEARSRPGSGLGLAIVAQVAADHGGSVEADEAPGGGARLRLHLPPSPT